MFTSIPKSGFFPMEIETAQQYLQNRRFDVDIDGDELTVESKHIDLSEAGSGGEQLAGFVRGIEQALSIPGNFTPENWSFTEAAGAMVPLIEHETFEKGFRQITGETAISEGFFEEMAIFYQIEIRGGSRLLTEELMEAWSATVDQVDSAARSILYHKTQNQSSSAVADREFVEQFSLPDGYNASRSLILCDVFYHQFGESTRFTIPSNELLLFVDEPTEEKIEELLEVTDDSYERTMIPLSRSLYKFDRRGKPELERER